MLDLLILSSFFKYVLKENNEKTGTAEVKKILANLFTAYTLIEMSITTKDHHSTKTLRTIFLIFF